MNPQGALEFGIRLRKCCRLAARWQGQSLCLAVSDPKGDLFVSEPLIVDGSGVLDFVLARTAAFLFSPLSFKPGKGRLQRRRDMSRKERSFVPHL